MEQIKVSPLQDKAPLVGWDVGLVIAANLRDPGSGFLAAPAPAKA